MDEPITPKPWYRRSELWIAVVTGILGILVALGAIGPDEQSAWLAIATRIIGALLGVGAVSAYTISRGLAKFGTGD